MGNETVIIVMDGMHVYIHYAVHWVDITGELQYTKKADRRNKKVITYYGKLWRSTDRKNITKGDMIIIPQVGEY